MLRAGAIAGFAGVIGLIPLAILCLRQARALRELKAWAGSAPGRSVSVQKRSGGMRTPLLAVCAAALALAGVAVAVGPLELLPAHHAARTAAVAQAKPRSARVQVLNASGVPGLAKRTAARLRRRGFKVAGTGNASEAVSASRVVFIARGHAEARKVRRALRIPAPPRRALRAYGGAEVIVILGSDAAASG